MGGSRWVEWFRTDSTDIEGVSRALKTAQECLDVAHMPWFKKFLEKLDEEAMKPSMIGDHFAMIAATARANALKQLRADLLDEIARAQAFIDASKEN